MKFNINKKNVGLRIRQIRNALNLTLEEFGKIFSSDINSKLNAGKSNVSTWERGDSLPNKQRLDIIAKKGNISVNKLLYGSIDEFLENNINILIENSDYPYPSSFKSFDIKYGVIDFIEMLKFSDNKIVVIDNIDDVVEVFYMYFNSNIVDEVLGKIDEIIKLSEDNKPEVVNVLRDYFFNKGNIFIALRDNKKSLKNEFYTYASDYDNFITFLKEGDFKHKIKFYPWIIDLIELIYKEIDGYFLTIKSSLNTYSLKEILDYNDEHKENDFFPIINYSAGKDYTLIELKENKYKITGFKSVTGIYTEVDDTLYYLAHYRCIDKVPLNTEAEYFILNHDNTYQITKITELPDCKYIAPIIGRLE